MKLIYKIEFNSTVFYFKNLIDELIKNSKIDATTKQYFGYILVIIDDEKEKIESFFLNLEKNLPISMFISKATFIENFDETTQELENKNLNINFEILTLNSVKEILNNNYFDFLAQIVSLKMSEVVEFKNKKLFLPNLKLQNEFEKQNLEVKVLVTNSNNISKNFIVDNQTLALLSSIERPLVKLKIEDKNLEFFANSYIYTKLPSNKDEIVLAQALKEQGVDYILYVTSKDELKAINSGSRNIIEKISDDFFPKYDYNLNRIYNNKDEFFSTFQNLYEAILSYENKESVSSLGIYFSKTNDSFVDINVPVNEKKRVIYIPNIQNSISKIFEDIASIDENTERLIENFNKKFPEVKEKKLSDFNSFLAIIEACSIVLDINNITEFENLALNSSFSNSVQIDMKLIKIDNKNYLDYRRIIQSIMSYKMAGVENEILAYSFYEFLSEFIINYSKEIAKKISAKDIVICGDMFANRLILNKVTKELSKNYNLILPKEYPLDY